MTANSINLVGEDHPTLYTPADEVPEGTDIRELAAQMRIIMTNHKALGLAANQVGVLQQVIVMNVIPQVINMTLVNPVIIKRYGGRVRGREVCLTYVDYSVTRRRYKRVDIEALNEHGEKIYLKLKGLAARCAQHEIDHLRGITIKRIKL